MNAFNYCAREAIWLNSSGLYANHHVALIGHDTTGYILKDSFITILETFAFW